MHALHEAGKRPPQAAKNLRAKEVEHRSAGLAGPHGADGILHAGRRRVRAAFQRQAREVLLERLRAPAELPVGLSGLTELDPDDAVALLDGRGLKVGHHIPGAEVHLRLGLVVEFLERGGAHEYGQ